MKKVLIITIVNFLFFLPLEAFASEPSLNLVFHQSEDGKVLAGSLEALKQAVRDGKRIRIYMKLRTIEHTMDSGFLSIFNGKVYAQINTIQGQRPNRQTGNVELRPYAKHVGLYSTDSPYEIKWFAF